MRKTHTRGWVTLVAILQNVAASSSGIPHFAFSTRPKSALSLLEANPRFSCWHKSVGSFYGGIVRFIIANNQECMKLQDKSEYHRIAVYTYTAHPRRQLLRPFLHCSLRSLLIFSVGPVCQDLAALQALCWSTTFIGGAGCMLHATVRHFVVSS